MTSSDPGRMVTTLMDAGWQVAGHKTGVYVRLAWPNDKSRSLLVPLDPTAPEFEELLRAAVNQLEDAVRTGRSAAEALTAYDPEMYAQNA